MEPDIEAERDNSSRVYLRRVIAGFAAELPPDARVIDAGGGLGRYGVLFDRQRYETADRRPEANYVCDLHEIPVADATFDAALSTQTIEHVGEPGIVLAEIARVLKPGAPLLLTGPFIYEEHLQPDDYYRFTSFGFTRLVTAAGFRIDRTTWLEGFFGTLGYLLRTASDALAALDTAGYSPIDARIIHAAEGNLALMGQSFNEMDLRRKEVSVGFPLNYVVRATKL